MNFILKQLSDLLSRIACLIPVPVAFQISRWAGSIIYIFLASRRKLALRNLDIAYGVSKTAIEKKKIAKHSFQNMAISAVELFMMPRMVREAPSRFRFSNLQFLEKAFAKGKGVILVISHLGSWEYLSFLPFLTGQRWSVVVKNIKNRYLDDKINYLRRMTTLNPISKDAFVRSIIRELNQKNGVAILIDQWAGNEGIWLEFFGELTSTTSVPARLAMRLGSPLVPSCCIRTSAGQYEIQFQDALVTEGKDEKQITLELNKLLEDKIRQYPGQWLWMHNRWKVKPPTSRR